jgi:type IV pilus biogenesis protein PilP
MRPPGDASALLMLAVLATSSAAQTIADYSRAQRAFIEAGMAQATARAAAMAASGVASSASGPSKPPAVSEPQPPAEPPLPVVTVEGVFDSGVRTLAEISVDGHPYLLSTGQTVPGTAWHVEAIEIDRVVLTRTARERAPAGGRVVASKVFALPALR